MPIEIENLYEIRRQDLPRLVETYKDAFSEYPKLCGVFPAKEKRLAALESTLWFYCAYDLKFGKGYALDAEMREAALLGEAEEMRYTTLRHLRAGSWSAGYRQALAALTREERRLRNRLFAELDRLETTISLPKKHIYVDFLGVRQDFQRQGRGRRLMERICAYADRRGLPLMLFTNTEADVRFYQSLGFQTVGVTRSLEFQFENTYLVRER